MGISTHILDTALGRPAAGVYVTLQLRVAGDWVELHSATTDMDGRCRQMLPDGVEATPGVYRLHFATGSYFAATTVPALYPWVEIAFEVRERGQSFHIPLLLTANSYSTYRGS